MKTVTVTLAFVLAVGTSDAQWERTNGPYGGYITSVASSGVNLFAGTYGGVFLSSDGGARWSLVNAGLTNTDIRSLVGFAGNVFAGTSGGAFRSTNNGSSWMAANTGLPATLTVNCFAFAGTRLFAGTSSGLFMSPDSGSSWRPFTNWTIEVRALAIDGTKLFAATPPYMCVSTDDGATWTSSLLTASSISSVVVSGTNVFAGTAGGGVFLSTNNGTAWSAASDGLIDSVSVTTINALAVQAASVFAAVSVVKRTSGSVTGDVFLSTNNGTTWTRVDHGLLHAPVYSLTLFGSAVLAGTGCGVFVSTDNGSVWKPTGAVGSPNVHISALLVRGQEIFAGVAWRKSGREEVRGFGVGLYHSSDNGDSWVPQLGTNAVAFAMQGDDVFAGTPMGVYRTSDGGATWIPQNEGLPKDVYDSTRYRVTCLASTGQKLLAGTSGGGVYVTTNNGAQWTAANNGLTNMDIATLAIAGTNAFAAAAGGGVFVSTDEGAHWSAANAGLPDTNSTSVNAFAARGASVFAALSSGGIYRYDPTSNAWSAANQGLPLDPFTIPPSYPLITCFGGDGSSLFASSAMGGLFLSTDSGAGWRSIDSASIPMTANLGFNVAYIYVGTGGIGMMSESGTGLWRRLRSELYTSVQTSGSEKPQACTLWQNYPNPFNPTTKIQFTIVDRQLTIVKVFDLLGRDVATLVNEVKEAGTHTVEFDGTNLSSGVYFCRLQAGDPSTGSGQAFTQTNRIVLLK